MDTSNFKEVFTSDEVKKLRAENEMLYYEAQRLDSLATVVDGSRLRSGMTKSCGCLKAEAHTLAHDLDINKSVWGRILRNLSSWG